MRVARYNALRALNFICSNRVVIPERCRFFINPQSTKCRRYAVLMPGLKIFHACLTSPFRLNAHTFPNNIQSNPAAMLLFGRAPKFLYLILYPIFLYPTFLYPTFLYPTFLYPTFLYPTFLYPTFLYPTFLDPTFLYPTFLDPTFLYPILLIPALARSARVAGGGSDYLLIS
jgi:hypothetical protein